jgi:peptidoglycan/LPS O-acetylase OafA/YrhL
MEKAGRHRYEVLDGVRGVAAVCVMIFHYGQATSYTVFSCAGLAVDLFFMLSGFVITHAYADKLRNGMRASQFLSMRLIRLYPMLFFGTGLGAIVLFEVMARGLTNYSKMDLVGSAIYNSFFLPFINDRTIHNFGLSFSYVGEIFPSDPPAWSLFFEMLASSAFVFLTRLSRVTLVNVTVWCFAAFLIVGTLNALVEHRLAFNFVQGWNSASFIGGIPRVFFGFSLGIVIYRAANDGQLGSLAKLDVLIRHPYLLFSAVVLVLACPTDMSGLYTGLMLITFLPLFIVVGSGMQCSGLCRQVCLFLGWISYPIYCLHYPIGRAVFLISDGRGYSHENALIVSMICTVVCAAIVAKVYDGPVRSWLTAKLSRPRRLYAV